jgi:hypothetical protein
MSRLPTTPRGTSEGDLLIDLAHRRGFHVRATGDGIYEVERGGARCFKGTAAEVHRWLRDKKGAA